jgi:VRR-NUC domain
MSVLKESDIEHLTVAWATDNGWLCPKLQWLSQTGWPDRCFMKNGMVVFIEFKKPGGVISKKQRHWIQKIRDHAVPATVCDSVIDAQAFLRSYE